MPSKGRWEAAWQDRPQEEASVFNPAFCGDLIFRAMRGYYQMRKRPFNFGLSFLVLPIVLHKPTRDILPGNASAAFTAWSAERSGLLVGLPDRISRLVPITRESLSFLMQNSAVQVAQGGLVAGPKPIAISAKLEWTTKDADDARHAAALLGRWFANQGPASVIMQGFGVTP